MHAGWLMNDTWVLVFQKIVFLGAILEMAK
jgi:hypothetical protein